MRRAAIHATLIFSTLLWGCGVSDVVLSTRDAASPDGSVDALVDGLDAGPPDLIGPPAFDPGPCTTDDWCWVLPEPQGNNLNAVWGSSPHDVYAVGDARTIVHFDGSSWKVVASGLPADEVLVNYEAVWGFSASDVFVGGRDGLLHFDGSAWHSHGWSGIYAPEIHGLWGNSRSTLYAVGGMPSSEGLKSAILRFDGNGWAQMATPTTRRLTTVWGFSPSEVFAAGERGSILRLAGESWEVMDSGVEDRINALWGTSPSQVFVGTQAGDILRFDGSRWETFHTVQYANINAIWGHSATDIFFATSEGVLHYDGSSFSERSDVLGVNGFWGPAGGTTIAVGSSGRIHVEEGATFDQQAGGTLGSCYDVWARSATEVYIVGHQELLLWDGTSLSSVRTFNQSYTEHICGQPSGGLMVMGSFSVHQRDSEGNWSKHLSPLPLTDIWCSPTSEHAVAVGWMGHIEHFDGAQWTSVEMDSSLEFRGVWGDTPTNIYAIDWNGKLAHHDGASWSVVQNVDFGPGSSAIGGRSATELYVLSNSGLDAFNGVERVVDKDLSLGFFGKALGGSSEHLFASTKLGSLFHLADAEWVAQASPASREISAFSVFGKDAWAVGSGGMLLHRVLP
ncbi:MAG: hypothetical protein JRH20_16425 [Deltaproteobacteria bacterium]|nr:hypothetical protein [Deltaproteobacteria bacterium]